MVLLLLLLLLLLAGCLPFQIIAESDLLSVTDNYYNLEDQVYNNKEFTYDKVRPSPSKPPAQPECAP